MAHRCIRIEKARSGRETRIEVDGWPGGNDRKWVAYTPETAPATMRESGAEWDPGDLRARALRLGKSIKDRASGASKGRAIRAYGWHRWQPNVAVAELLLHVEGGSKPLLITRFNSSTQLIESEHYAVRTFLLSCAADIAEALQTEAHIDHGWVDWKVPKRLVDDVVRAAPGFAPHRQRGKRRPRGGDVILRWCPLEAGG